MIRLFNVEGIVQLRDVIDTSHASVLLLDFAKYGSLYNLSRGRWPLAATEVLNIIFLVIK